MHGPFNARPKLPAGLRGRPQRGARRRRRRPRHVGRHGGGLRAELRERADRRLPAGPLRRPLRREPVRRVRGRLHGGGRRQRLGVGEAVLRPREEHLRTGAGVRALHAGRVARLDYDRVRARGVQQWLDIHHLQL